VKFGEALPQTCRRKGVDQCGNIAAWYPVVRVFAKGYKLAPPAQMIMSLATCEACTKLVDVQDLVTDEGWKKIVDVLSAAGKAEPDRTRTQITWWPITEAAAGRLPE
jgi:hypothetical protein